MELIHEADGTWTLKGLTDEDVAGYYFATSDYAHRLKMELVTRTIAGEPVGEEDVEFLEQTAPKAERVWDRYSDECETILEAAGLI